MFSDEYQTLESEAETVIQDSGSRLIAIAAPADSEKKALALFERQSSKHPDAVESIFCYKIGIDPDSKTYLSAENDIAKTIYGVIVSSELTNVFLTVFREKVEKQATTPSLLAYRDAAANAVRRARTVKRILYDTVHFRVPLGDVDMVSRLITDQRGKILQTQPGDPPVLIVKIRKTQSDELQKMVITAAHGRVSVIGQ